MRKEIYLNLTTTGSDHLSNLKAALSELKRNNILVSFFLNEIEIRITETIKDSEIPAEGAREAVIHLIQLKNLIAGGAIKEIESIFKIRELKQGKGNLSKEKMTDELKEKIKA